MALKRIKPKSIVSSLSVITLFIANCAAANRLSEHKTQPPLEYCPQLLPVLDEKAMLPDVSKISNTRGFSSTSTS